MKNKTSAIAVLVVGVLILLLAAFAGNIGLADVPGLSSQQTIGVIVGVIVLAAGAYLIQDSDAGNGSVRRDDGNDNDKGWLDSLTKAEEINSAESDDNERRG